MSSQDIVFKNVDNFTEAKYIIGKITTTWDTAADLEGVLLKDGRLSLVQIKNRDVGTVIFDIYQCPDILKVRGGLRDLLESLDHAKILHDCRHDYNGLLGQFNIRMVNVMVKHREGLWEQRPLPEYLLQYAAFDVEHLENITVQLD